MSNSTARVGARAASFAGAAAALLASVLIASLTGCGDDGGTPAPAARPTPPAKPAPAAPAPAPPPTPPPAAPAADASSGDPARGATQYAMMCASCHGATGAGDGPVAVTLNPRPAAHNDAAYMDPLTDEYLFRVVKEGGLAVGKSPMMAPWGGALSDAQIWDVVAYMRTLSK